MLPGTPTRAALAALAVLTPAALVACGSEADPGNAPADATRTGGTAPASPDAEPQRADVATGLDTPWGLVATPDDRVLVGSRDTGTIRVLDPATGEVSEPLTTVGVRAEGESGLLGLALTPDGGTLLAYLTTAEDGRVVAMSYDDSGDLPVLGDPEPVVTGIPGGATYHQGGGMVVGPDDLLYVSTGDNGVPENAQDLDSLSGKILRYTLDGQPAPDNPFGTAVYSYGHRNVEGLTFDDAGRLWASEFGSSRWDELNLITAGSNYGWPEVEGTGGTDDGYVDPLAVWRTADASPAGLAWWDGSLWMASLKGETLWEIPLPDLADAAADGSEPATDPADEEVGDPVGWFGYDLGRLRSALADPTGDGLLVTTSNTDGRGSERDGDDRVLRVTR
ncbi:MAG: glucose sorbosone dehydrogenase [Nocardioides sp.]|nr:glucose sorbosone dehydrogenase [Nocardioides sp.]